MLPALGTNQIAGFASAHRPLMYWEQKILTDGRIVYSRPCPAVWSEAYNFLSVDNRPLKQQINFWNCSTFLNKHLIFLRSIKNFSFEILWKFLTARHLVYLRPCPAVGHLATGILKRLHWVILHCKMNLLQQYYLNFLVFCLSYKCTRLIYYGYC